MAKNEGSKLIVPEGAILMVYPIHNSRPSHSANRVFPINGKYDVEFLTITESGMDWKVERPWLTFVMQGKRYGIAPEDMNRVFIADGDYYIKNE